MGMIKTIEKMVEAFGDYTSAFGQALEAHGIEFGEQQMESDRKARQAIQAGRALLEELNGHKDKPCQTCEALARTVMLDQSSNDAAQRTWVGTLSLEQLLHTAANWGANYPKGEEFSDALSKKVQQWIEFYSGETYMNPPQAKPAPVQNESVVWNEDQAYAWGRGCYEIAQGATTGWKLFGQLTPKEQAYWVAKDAFEQAAPQARPAAPEGWKLVPEVPTNEMTSAMADALEDPENERSSWDLAENMYRAMLAAAPQGSDKK